MNIVCLTSNAYRGCLEPFAYYWNRFAGEDRPVLIAHYEVEPPPLPRNFNTYCLGEQRRYTWSGGLRKLLTVLDEELVLLLLEDYFLTESVDWEMVERLEHLLLERPDVAKIDLSNDRLKVGHHADADHDDLIVSDWDAPFQMSMQAALWRSDFLYRWLDPTENAWQAEKRGTKRLLQARQNGECVDLILGCRVPPLSYANAVGGEGNFPGVITTKYMPTWMRDECVVKGWVHG